MIILDHGNICVGANFMILSCIVFQIMTKLGFSIIMHSFPDIEENLFFDNDGPHLHKHNMHMILQHFK